MKNYVLYYGNIFDLIKYLTKFNIILIGNLERDMNELTDLLFRDDINHNDLYINFLVKINFKPEFIEFQMGNN